MSKTVFEVDKKLNLKARGSLGQALRSLREASLSNCIMQSVSAFNQIDKEYRKAMANDGVIMGSERTDIIQKIDLFFDLLLLTWKHLERKPRDVSFQIENRETAFFFSLVENNNLWRASGRISPTFLSPAANFRVLYRGRLAPDIIDLLNRYKAVFADRKLNEEEVVEIKEEIKQMVYDILLLRFQLEKCLIDS